MGSNDTSPWQSDKVTSMPCVIFPISLAILCICGSQSDQNVLLEFLHPLRWLPVSHVAMFDLATSALSL